MHGRSLTDGQVSASRFAAAVRDLDADVIGLQEVDHAQPRSGGLDLTALAADAVGARPADCHFEATVYGTPGLSWRPADGDRQADEPSYGIS
nr:endonuclease [Micromonospora sp. DSM 115978]